MSINSFGTPIEILLVEDNPGDVRLTQEALKIGKIKNNIHVVEDGEKALAFLYKKDNYSNAPFPDIILLDLNIPKKSGREILAIIKEDKNLRRIPVVILTSSKAEEDIDRTYKLHANCYVIKPLELEDFNRVILSIENFWLTFVRFPPK